MALQTRVTFELYYRSKDEEPETFYVDDNVDEDRRLLVETADSEIYTPNTSTMRRDDAKRYVADAAARYSTSSTRP